MKSVSEVCFQYPFDILYRSFCAVKDENEFAYFFSKVLLFSVLEQVFENFLYSIVRLASIVQASLIVYSLYTAGSLLTQPPFLLSHFRNMYAILRSPISSTSMFA